MNWLTIARYLPDGLSALICVAPRTAALLFSSIVSLGCGTPNHRDSYSATPSQSPENRPSRVKSSGSATATLNTTDAGAIASVLIDTPIFYLDRRSEVRKIGYLRKGAEVVVTTSQPLDDYVRVETDFPEAPPPIINTKTIKSRAFRFGASGLGALVPKLATQTSLSKLGDQQSLDWGYHRSLHLFPSGPRFSILLCGHIRELEHRGDYALVAAEYPFGELWGWIPTGAGYPRQRRGGDDACPAGRFPSVPSDYSVPFAAQLDQNPLNARLLPGSSFFFLQKNEKREESLKCQKVQVGENRSQPGTVLNFVDARGIVRTSPLTIAPDRLYISGDSLSDDGRIIEKRVDFGLHLRAVTERENSIGFVKFGYESDDAVAYYHDSAVLWWDPDVETCNRRRLESDERQFFETAQ